METLCLLYETYEQALAACQTIPPKQEEAVFVGPGVHVLPTERPYRIPIQHASGWAVILDDHVRSYLQGEEVQFQPPESEEEIL